MSPFKEKIKNLSLSDQMLFEEFGRGLEVNPSHNNILLAFEEMVALYPQLVAIEHLSESITYENLNQQAEHLAVELLSHGVQRGDHVGLFIQRSIPMVVGILAILKTGAAYVPQDARITPINQLNHVIDTASLKIILTISELSHLIPQSDKTHIISIDESMKKTSELKIRNAKPQILPNDTCFVLFTSGTTGLPNGVQVTHANVCNILLTEPGSLYMKPGLKVSQILNISFDMAAWEILGALSHGSTLVIRGKNIQQAVEKVDIVIATPSILASLNINSCQNVKVVAVAGEPCPQPLADAWSSFCTFYNSCGPTEVTIVNTMQNYKSTQGLLTIGKPTPNNTVYILNEDLSPCAIGEIGEMWAGGACVSKGYLRNDMLNHERYKPDPFLGGEHRMFRTRDLGRWTLNGELEHFGRTDDQVKIRGFRVELDSVSRALESTPECKQAVTLKLDSRNLVSFVSPRNIDIDLAKKIIADSLPYYSHPSLIISLDEFPMTSRGKIDKRALTILAVEKQEEQKIHLESHGAL